MSSSSIQSIAPPSSSVSTVSATPHKRDHRLEQEYGNTFEIWEGPLKFVREGEESGGQKKKAGDMESETRQAVRRGSRIYSTQSHQSQQYVDLTSSPSSPPITASTSPPPLTRPRAVPFYPSPLPRTALTPPRRSAQNPTRTNNQSNKPVHPFFLSTGNNNNDQPSTSTRSISTLSISSNSSFSTTNSHSHHRLNISQAYHSSGSSTGGSSQFTPPPPMSQPRMAGFYSTSTRLGASSESSGSFSGSVNGSGRMESSGVISEGEEEVEGAGKQCDTRGKIERSLVSPRSRSNLSATSTSLSASASTSYKSLNDRSASPAFLDLDPQMIQELENISFGVSDKDKREMDDMIAEEREVPGGFGFTAIRQEAKVRAKGKSKARDDGVGAENGGIRTKNIYPSLNGLGGLNDSFGKLGVSTKVNQVNGKVVAGQARKNSMDKGKGKAISAGTKTNTTTKPSWTKTNSSTLPSTFTDAKPILPFSYKTYIHKSTSLSPEFNHSTPYRPPSIVYTTSLEEANDLLSCLKGPIIGFDLEWPVWTGKIKKKAGGSEGGSWMKPGKVALVQVGDERIVLLIHVALMGGFPEKLKELCMDSSKIKIGVGIKNDGHKLARDFSIRSRSLLELSSLARKVDPIGTGPGSVMISLRNLVKGYLGYELEKGDVRTSDWSVKLTREQQEYAANDVVSAVLLYNRLIAIAKSRSINYDLPTIDLHAELAENDKVMLQARRSGSPTPSLTSKQGGLTPSELRCYVLFSLGKSSEEIGRTMRSREEPLKLSTVQSYLIIAITKDPELVFDKPRMHALLSEGDAYRTQVHRQMLLKLKDGIVVEKKVD